MEKKLAVCVSGIGSILQAIIESGIQVSLVIADRRCNGIEIAHEYDIPFEIVPRSDY